MSRSMILCNYCAAPLQHGRCPRCNYRRQKEGQAVFNGFIEAGGGGTAPTTIITPVGGGTSFLSTVTISGVAVPAGAMLVVFAGITGDGSEATPSTVTFGGVPLAATQDHFNFDSTLYADCFFRPPTGSPASGTVVATNTDPALDVNFALVDLLFGPASYRQSWFNQSPAPQSSGSISIAVDPTDSEYSVIWVRDAATDPGSWTGVTPGGGLAIGGTFGKGWLSSAFRIYATHSTEVATKAISPAAAWSIHTTEFQSP